MRSLAATIEHLIHTEAVSRLGDAFKVHEHTPARQRCGLAVGAFCSNSRTHLVYREESRLAVKRRWLEACFVGGRCYFEGVCFETAVILAPGAMTGGVGAAVADTVSVSSASSGSSGSSASEFREGTDDCENIMHRAIFPGK